ncbi:methyltransferase domain-containing protein [Flavobacterium succinicans]|uniref:Histone methylation protein DOT1 n=1 Tax=Flavobacterium succinicans TaxID=29536 RepID=A0A199XP88_9FLAO|nr:methyltransferase domain-containing protein [Flavobacterium succinicans]OAZ03217.1 histone methylation protein DOT1 [Flavobacterium succinicans]
MKVFNKIQAEIDTYSERIENTLSLPEITIQHGLNSFRYQSSSFLEVIFDAIQITSETVFYDLGSGYGNIILFGALKYPEAQFKGIEILPERNQVCASIIQKEQIVNASAICGDILKADVSDGNIFYLYNPLFDFQYGELLNKLYQISLIKSIVVIAESRCIYFDQTDWLKQYHEIDIDIVRKIKFYRSKSLSYDLQEKK